MKVAIVTPIFDNWPAFGRLLQEISQLASDPALALETIAVHDCSSDSFELHRPALTTGAIRSIEILHLGLNLVHQRAIAVGQVNTLLAGKI